LDGNKTLLCPPSKTRTSQRTLPRPTYTGQPNATKTVRSKQTLGWQSTSPPTGVCLVESTGFFFLPPPPRGRPNPTAVSSPQPGPGVNANAGRDPLEVQSPSLRSFSSNPPAPLFSQSSSPRPETDIFDDLFFVPVEECRTSPLETQWRATCVSKFFFHNTGASRTAASTGSAPLIVGSIPNWMVNRIAPPREARPFHENGESPTKVKASK